jgi:mono/diheme cytochrome c family protein
MRERYIYRNTFNLLSLLFIVILLGLNLIFSSSFGQQTPWVAPAAASSVKNPLAGNNSGLAVAKAMYVANCGPCHGEKGKGDGPAAPGLNPKPADHTSAAVQGETDGSLFWKLSEGRNPMPGYKKIFSDQQRWDLINYIRTLAKNTKKK